MNNKRRKEITKVMDDIGMLQNRIDELRIEEMKYAENMPENLQNSDRYKRAWECIRQLKYACNIIDEAVAYLYYAAE